MKIIVISITKYKEKDAIIDAIGEQGDITFLAKGVFDPKNKNAQINNPLTIAEIELNEGSYKYPVLKSATTEFVPMKLKNDYYYLGSLLLVAEATKTMLQQEEKERIFNSLSETIRALKEAKEPWNILLAYFAKLITITGYELEVNKCVFCGTKQGIITFSFKDGGFVCKDCLEDDMERDLTNTQMLLIRSAFNAKNIQNLEFECTKEDGLKVLNKFFEFIQDSYGVTFKSATLINK